MVFQSIYNHDSFIFQGEENDGTLHVVPNEALSPKQILDRFVRDMPVPATSHDSGICNDSLDNEAFPMQGQEYDPLDVMNEIMQSKNTNLDS